jgi:dipeptidyl aminopeptidase/acylaminoacyl peptidase
MNHLLDLNKDQLINYIVEMDYYRYLELSIAPDDQEALIVFGNDDMAYEYLANDIGNRSIWKLNLRDGKTINILSSEEDAHSPCWSPDGSKIAYLTYHSGKMELWVMNRDGSENRQITNTDFPVRNPFNHTELRWSPDGTKIAYTLVPNGSIASLNNDFRNKRPTDDIIIHKTRKQDNQAYHNYISSLNRTALFVVDIETRQSKAIISDSSEIIEIVDWGDEKDTLLVKIGHKLNETIVQTNEIQQICSENVGLINKLASDFYTATVKGACVEIGTINEGKLETLHKVEVPGSEINLHDWSYDAKQILLSAREGVSNYLFSIETTTGILNKLTEEGKIVHSSYTHRARPKFFNKNNHILFPYGGPSEPMEIWQIDSDGLLQKVSHFNKAQFPVNLPDSRIIRYESDGWNIESLLVLPANYVKGQRYPTLVFLHGGPEGAILADFTQINSAGGQSAAFYLASQGYAVLLPNFRGSSGYGHEFEKELGNLQIMRNPYKDVIAGVDYLIEQGITNPEELGIYGMSYGGGLATWAVSQTERFKGAIGICGVHDWLLWDREYGVPFHAFRPNRLGESDPKDMWLRPEVYKELSTIENIGSIKCPVLLIETGGERRWDGAQWKSDAKSLFLGLHGLGIETNLICYTRAFHGGGWNRIYQKDYINRISAWFDFCIKGVPLPEWYDMNS